jgi:hypothetical protein
VSNRIPLQGFIGSAFKAQSPKFESQDLWNWYVERAESQHHKSPQALLPCPGFELFCTLPDTPVRGMYAQNDRVFAVGGESLFELTRLGQVLPRTQTVLLPPPTPIITNSDVDKPITAVPQVVVTHGGTIATTPYGYKVTATNKHGETEASAEGTSPYGNPILSATNWNIVSWGAVQDATGSKVYRTTGGTAPPKLVAVLVSTTLVFHDIGQTGEAVTPPTVNTTAGVVGTTTWGYKVSATIGLGETQASAEGVTVTGQATLSSTIYNIIKWTKVVNARGYKVYRTTGGVSPPVLIATIGAGDTLEARDTGQTGESATPPTTNTTGTSEIKNDGSPVSICSSGDAGEQLLIVSGGTAYCYDLATDVLAPVVEGATFGGFIDSYFVVLDAGTSTLKVSESLNGFLWDPTQIYQRLRAGDKWLSMAVTSNEIWLIGSQTGEVWQGTGIDASRFTPYMPVFLETGIIAGSSLVRIAGALMWLAQDKDGAGFVVRANGYTPQPVSTTAVNFSIQNLATIADAFAFTYQQEGHVFYVLTCPTDEVTWVYDITTNEWHKRGYWDPNDMRFTAYRPQCHTFGFGGIGFGMNLVGDRLSGTIAKINPAFGRDIDGALIRRVRQCPHLADRGQELTVDRLQMDMDVGEGIQLGQGSNPTMMLSYSNDGAKTFGKELWRSAGRQGQWGIQVAWSRLGTSKDRVFRLVCTDPIPWRLVGAWIELEGS